MKCTEENISRDLKYHIDKQISLSDCVFRIGSDSWGRLLREARGLFLEGKIDDIDEDEYFLLESDAGEIGKDLNGNPVFLDTPYRDWNEGVTFAFVKNPQGKIIRVEYPDMDMLGA